MDSLSINSRYEVVMSEAEAILPGTDYNHLPVELQEIILNNLTYKDLSQAELVCKKWRKVAYRPSVRGIDSAWIVKKIGYSQPIELNPTLPFIQNGIIEIAFQTSDLLAIRELHQNKLAIISKLPSYSSAFLMDDCGKLLFKDHEIALFKRGTSAYELILFDLVHSRMMGRFDLRNALNDEDKAHDEMRAFQTCVACFKNPHNQLVTISRAGTVAFWYVNHEEIIPFAKHQIFYDNADLVRTGVQSVEKIGDIYLVESSYQNLFLRIDSTSITPLGQIFAYYPNFVGANENHFYVRVCKDQLHCYRIGEKLDLNQPQNTYPCMTDETGHKVDLQEQDISNKWVLLSRRSPNKRGTKVELLVLDASGLSYMMSQITLIPHQASHSKQVIMKLCGDFVICALGNCLQPFYIPHKLTLPRIYISQDECITDFVMEEDRLIVSARDDNLGKFKVLIFTLNDLVNNGS